MSKQSLQASPFLGGYTKTLGNTTLSEVSDLAIVAVSIPINAQDAFVSALKKHYGTKVPKVGETTSSKDGKMQFLGMSQDQLFAIFPYEGVDAEIVLKKNLGDVAYYTLQSDNWSILRLSGERSPAALERTCQLDLDILSFPVGNVARTVMEHMGCIILRVDHEEFILMSLSSMAHSFQHMLETSLKNVC